jgi:hypothetical protein
VIVIVKANLDHLDHLGHLGIREKPDHLVIKVLRVKKAKLVKKETKVIRVKKAKLVKKVIKVVLVKKVTE